MITLKLHIKSCSDSSLSDEYISQYTGLFYKLYNNSELMNDKNFITEMKIKFPLFDYPMYESCVNEVQTKLKIQETYRKKAKQQIKEIENLLSKDNFKTKKQKRIKFKLIKKLASLKRNLNNNICFGGKELLKSISQQAKTNPILYEKNLKEFKKNRKLGVYLVGRIADNGNRKIDFSFLNENKVIFKSKKGIRIEYVFNSSIKQNKLLCKLQELALNKIIPITVRISNQFIYLIYDEERVAGFNFDMIGFNQYLKNNNIKTKKRKKEIFKQFKDEQRNRKLKNKVKDRYISVDLNPTEIGLTIADKLNDNGDFTVIHKELISFNGLSVKLRLSSSDPKQKYQNNKRKHEIKEIWSYIFKMAKHYKCAYFVVEDLEFKNSNKKEKTEFNRVTKNIWHRTLTTQLITKWCNTLGIEKVEVNPAYSSLIGNMCYTDYDPISSSLELMRRGIVKYIKGSNIYPSLLRINQDKLNYVLGENIRKTDIKDWKQLYQFISLNDAKLRYRNKDLTSLSETNLKHHQSGVFVHS